MGYKKVMSYNWIRSYNFLIIKLVLGVTHYFLNRISSLTIYRIHTKSYTPFCSEFNFSQNQQSVFEIVRPMLNIRRKFLHSYSLPIFFFWIQNLLGSHLLWKVSLPMKLFLKKSARTNGKNFEITLNWSFFLLILDYCQSLDNIVFHFKFSQKTFPPGIWIHSFCIFFLKFSNEIKKNRNSHLCLMQSKLNILILNGATDKK